jgi:hypothetical protein
MLHAFRRPAITVKMFIKPVCGKDLHHITVQDTPAVNSDDNKQNFNPMISRWAIINRKSPGHIQHTHSHMDHIVHDG